MSTTEIALTKAAVLAQALPWLLKFRDSILVIKFGGNAMTDVRLFKSFAEDITFLKLAGINPVVVHGGGPQISAALKQAGIETKFIKGLRHTEANAIRIIKNVLVNDIQFNIKKEINEIHECAVGLSGDERGLLKATKITQLDGEAVDLGLVGEIVQVDPSAVKEVIALGKVPVISTLAVDEQGNTLNVNADFAASALASALQAQKLVVLTDVIGLMSKYPDPDSLIPQITLKDLKKLLPDLDEGMKPKMQSCFWAVESGVPRAHVLDGRIEHGLMVEIFTDQGAGTMVIQDE